MFTPDANMIDIDPIAEFAGDYTAWEAAEYFAAMATPEPRHTRDPIAIMNDGWTYGWWFQLRGGKRSYQLTCDRSTRTWQVRVVSNRS